jgi:hypothetical protein
MVKVTQVHENSSGAELSYDKMVSSGDFDKVVKSTVGSKKYTRICGFSHKEIMDMKRRSWAEAVFVDELALWKDKDFMKMYPKKEETVEIPDGVEKEACLV